MEFMKYISLLSSCQGVFLGKITWGKGMILAHYRLPFEILYYETKMKNQEFRKEHCIMNLLFA